MSSLQKSLLRTLGARITRQFLDAREADVLFFFKSALTMTDKIARSLNNLTRNGCDFLSSEDSSALLDYLGEYLDDDEEMEHKLPYHTSSYDDGNE